MISDPATAIGVFAVIFCTTVALFFLFREITCWYFKFNEMLTVFYQMNKNMEYTKLYLKALCDFKDKYKVTGAGAVGSFKDIVSDIIGKAVADNLVAQSKVLRDAVKNEEKEENKL